MTVFRYSLLMAAACLSVSTFAQTPSKTPPKKVEKEAVQPKQTPVDPAPKSSIQSVPDTIKKGTPKDLDAFFKEGQEQAEKGPTCRKPPVPVA